MSQTLRLLSADKGSEPHASFESVAAAPRSQLSRRKVFCLQAATGEYAWEYPQGEDESGSGGGPDRSEEAEAEAAAPIKVFSLLQQESGGVWVWGWSSQSTAFQKVVAPASSSFSSSSSSNSSLQSKSLSPRSPAEGKEEPYKPAQFPAAGGETACQGFLSIFVPSNSHLSCSVPPSCLLPSCPVLTCLVFPSCLISSRCEKSVAGSAHGRVAVLRQRLQP